MGLLSVDQSPSMDIFGIKMQIGLFLGTNSFIGLQADAEILDVSYFEKATSEFRFFLPTWKAYDMFEVPVFDRCRLTHQ